MHSSNPMPLSAARSCALAVLVFTAPLAFAADPSLPQQPASGRSDSPPPGSSRQAPILHFGAVRVDAGRRTVSIPARLHMTNGIIEYLLVTDYGKTHESLLLTESRPVEIQSALLLLNARPTGAGGLDLVSDHIPSSSLVRLTVTWNGPDGAHHELPVHKSVMLQPGSAPDAPVQPPAPMPPGPWLFNGSGFSVEGFMAHFEGSLVSLIRDPAAIVNNPHPDRDDDEIHIPAIAGLPAIGTEVHLVLTPVDEAGRPSPQP